MYLNCLLQTIKVLSGCCRNIYIRCVFCPRMDDQISVNAIKKVSKEFDEDYYERGPDSGKSLYSNYKWLPELTIPMAFNLIETLHIGRDRKVLDFGCAKGFLVKAFRLLSREAYGVDVSRYCIDQTHPDVKEYCKHSDGIDIPFDHSFDWTIAKDVLEHVPYESIDAVVKKIISKTNNLFIVVPLGSDGKYVVPAYELDVTHHVREPIGWWANLLERHGGKVTCAEYSFPGVKENWKDHKEGNGFLIAKKAE